MWFNYIKVSLRLLQRNKVYAFINIFGLAIGIFCSILLGMYVIDELSFDDFHEKKERLYRITSTLRQDKEITTGLTSLAVGPTLNDMFPEVENYTRLKPYYQKNLIQVGDKTFQEDGFYMADSTFFQVFSFNLLAGDPYKVLEKPNEIVLTQALAEKFFPHDKAIGKTITLNKKEVQVVGVCADIPGNSDIQFTALLSLSSFPEQYAQIYNEDWFRLSNYTYLVMNQPIGKERWDKIFTSLKENRVQKFIDENGLTGSVSYQAQNIKEVHFDNSKEYDSPKGNLNYVIIFGLIGIFILLIACINYINLSLAQSTKRAKEIGIRKTLGAARSGIIKQFITESVVLTLGAFLLGLVLVELFLPVFNNLTGKDFTFYDFFSPTIMILMAAIFSFISLVGGSYPAFVLSGFQPANVMKGRFSGIWDIGLVRKGLVVFQFAFSIAMIIGTLVVFDQMEYMKDKDLGFNQENVLVIELPPDTAVSNHLHTYTDQLLAHSAIDQAALSSGLPASVSGELLFRIEVDGQLKESGIKCLTVDDRYIDLMGLDILKGRNFDKAITTDMKEAFIVNEAAVAAYNWGEEPLGKRMQWGLLADNKAANDGKVIGVINDYNFYSLHNPIEPFVLIFRPKGGRYLNVRIKGGQVAQSLSLIEETWRKVGFTHPISYFFLSEKINEQYGDEKKMMTIFSTFSILSLLIACMGLFALTSFMVEQKTKELGIRKILGAGSGRITLLLSKDFLVLVGLAFFIAAPVSYYFLADWMSTFAYQAGVGPLAFFASLVFSFGLALLTVSYHTYKVTANNPANALRYE